MTRLSICPGCGYAHPTEPGATHAYVVTSPECWQRFGAISTTIRERLFTDAYMAQHPGGVDKRQTQSVAVHLVTLNAVLSHGQPPSQASQITQAAVDLGRLDHGYKRLPEPASWDLTIGDVDEGGTEGFNACRFSSRGLDEYTGQNDRGVDPSDPPIPIWELMGQAPIIYVMSS